MERSQTNRDTENYIPIRLTYNTFPLAVIFWVFVASSTIIMYHGMVLILDQLSAKGCQCCSSIRESASWTSTPIEDTPIPALVACLPSRLIACWDVKMILLTNCFHFGCAKVEKYSPTFGKRASRHTVRVSDRKRLQYHTYRAGNRDRKTTIHENEWPLNMSQTVSKRFFLNLWTFISY